MTPLFASSKEGVNRFKVQCPSKTRKPTIVLEVGSNAPLFYEDALHDMEFSNNDEPMDEEMIVDSDPAETFQILRLNIECGSIFSSLKHLPRRVVYVPFPYL